MQVARDRQNYAGKNPKRKSSDWFEGESSPFDWAGEFELIQNARKKQLVRSESDLSQLSRTVSDTSSYCSSPPTTPIRREHALAVKKEGKLSAVKKEGDCTFQVDWQGTCFECGLAVWVGPNENRTTKFEGICLACPSKREENQEPYCPACWRKEDDFLSVMGSSHKGKGKRQTQAKQGDKKQAKVGNKKHGKKKQQRRNQIKSRQQP